MQQQRRRHDTDAAASDLVGTLLLIGITVATTAAFASIILTYDGPEDTIRAAFDVSASPGSAGWDTGDEVLQLKHLGGEALRESDTSVIYSVNGARTVVTGSALGFSDDRFDIGETWSVSLQLKKTDEISVQVAVKGREGSAAVISSVTAIAGKTGGGCSTDTKAPIVAQWTQTPSDVASSTDGDVTVQIQALDVCSGVDDSAAVHLHYRINDGTNPSYTDAGAMTSLGSGSWSHTIPDPGWAQAGGSILQYFVSDLTDTAGNAGNSSLQTDTIAFDFAYTYVSSHVDTTGSIVDFANAQNASDGGAEAALDEGAVIIAPGTGSGSFSGNATAHSGATAPDNVFASDDFRATLDTTGEYVEVSGLDLPADATGITSVTIAFEGRKAQNGGSSPTATLSYSIGGVTGPTTGTAVLVNANDGTTTAVVTADRAWTVADVESMAIRVTGTIIGNRAVDVDHIYASVVYSTGGTVYRMDIELEWSGVPAGDVYQLGLGYRVAVESFSVSLWDGSAWSACAGSLGSTSATTFTCDMTAAQYNGGAPKARIQDLAPGGTSQGSVLLDYARVGVT